MKKRTLNPRSILGGVLVLTFIQVIGSGTAVADPSWTVTQVSNGNVRFDGSPAISGTNVVWIGTDGYICSNFAWQSPTKGGSPAISGINVVWRTTDGRIYGSGGELSTGTDNADPAISDGKVVWQGYSDAYHGQIYCNFGGSLTNYSNSGGPRSALRPDISGTSVVWEGWTDASHSQIYSNGGDSWSGPYAYNLYPAISGSKVIWISTNNGTNAVLYSNFFAGPLSDPGMECVSAAISEMNVVWLGSDNQLHTNFGGVVPIGDLNAGYPAISGTNVVWLGTDASNNHEIYMSTYGEAQVTPLPGAVLLGLLGLGTAGIKLRARV